MRLHVIADRPHEWFLLRDGENDPPHDEFYLDVNCNHGPVGFSMLVKLSEEEREEYRAVGRPYIESLAAKIMDGPERYRERDLSGSLGNEVTDAVRRFRSG